MQGIGQYFKGFFKDAVPFNNQAAPIARNHREEEGIKYLYKDLKSQCAWLFYKMIKEKQISIDSTLLERKYSETDLTRFLSDRFFRRSVRCSDVTRIAMIGDSSYYLRRLPRNMSDTRDFFESWFYVMIFSLTKKKNKKVKGLWMLSR